METLKRLSIFGGTGFVGSKFRALYSEHVWSVVNRDCYEVSSSDVLYLISTVDNYNIFDKPLLDIETNLTILVKVLEDWRKYLKHNPQGVFNFVSSWFVYGNGGSCVVNEYSPCNPMGFYSITKRAAEQLLVSYCQTYGLQYKILRLANVLGPEDKKVSAKKNALQYLISELKDDRPVQLYDGGNFVRDYIDVIDCCHAINIVLDHGWPNEIYNISNGVPLTFSHLIQTAAAKMGKQHLIGTKPTPEFHKAVQVGSLYLDNCRLKNLGYAPTLSIEDTLDRIINK